MEPKGIDLLVESGRMTKESGEAIKRSNPVYVPFFREFTEEIGVGIKAKKFIPKSLRAVMLNFQLELKLNTTAL